MQPLPPPKEENFIAACKNILCHGQLSELWDTLGKLSESNTRLPFEFSNALLQTLSFPYALPPAQEKPQRFIDKHVLKRNQFNLAQIREERVVGEQQYWGLDTGTQKKNFIQT